ncbi:hypothetical protein RND81_05G101400 [Saponaria officinalis]|uniref:AB hydrolase-1 domain-containing protein n=1 Tax=Saponaria officinalis TaxID=3572 RepID=A0AAW1KVJ9_SAPOF
MPFCKVSGDDNITQIFYQTYNNGPIKVLLLIGLAATHEAWMPQIKGLTGINVPNDDIESRVDDDEFDDVFDNGLQICALDNRGVGQSSIPTRKSEYSTTIMAKDAIAVMDHLGWRKAHIIGHSMGGMIALKLAALVPDRVLSLAVLNVTGGGFQILPKPCRLIVSIMVRFMLAKTPEDRAAVDLDTHYSQDYLKENVGESTRRAILFQEYVKGITNAGMQSNHGFEGQFSACWNHKMTETELEQIRSAGFLISVIHGRQDVIAQISHAKRLAVKLFPLAKLVDLEGGHLVTHERTREVNEELLKLIQASESKISPRDWTNLPDRTSSDWIGPRMLVLTKSAIRSSQSSFEQFNRFMIYFFGLFVLILEYMRRLAGRFKPVRVGPSLT